MNSLKEKTALVVGASGGIGSAVVKRLHSEGMNLAVSARGQEKLDALAQSLGGERISVFPADASSMSKVEGLFEEAKKQLGQIDLVFISSGGHEGLALKETPQAAAEMLERMIKGNLIAAFNVGFVAGKVLTQQRSGLIINISSHAAVKTLPGNLAYGPSKFGAFGFFSNLHDELRDAGVKVTDIQPATVNTPAMAKVLAKDKQRLAIQPEDIAELVVYLANNGPHVHIRNVLLDGDYQF